MTDEEYRARRKKLQGMAARGELISWCSHCLGERKDANSPILHLRPDCPYAEEYTPDPALGGFRPS